MWAAIAGFVTLVAAVWKWWVSPQRIKDEIAKLEKEREEIRAEMDRAYTAKDYDAYNNLDRKRVSICSEIYRLRCKL